MRLFDRFRRRLQRAPSDPVRSGPARVGVVTQVAVDVEGDATKLGVVLGGVFVVVVAVVVGCHAAGRCTASGEADGLLVDLATGPDLDARSGDAEDDLVVGGEFGGGA